MMLAGCVSEDRTRSFQRYNLIPFTQERSDDFVAIGDYFFHTTNFDKAKREISFFLKPDFSDIPICKPALQDSNFRISGTRAVGLRAKVIEYVALECKHPRNASIPPPPDDFRIEIFQINDTEQREYNPSIASYYKKVMIGGHLVSQAYMGESAYRIDFVCEKSSVSADSYGIQYEKLIEVLRPMLKNC